MISPFSPLSFLPPHTHTPRHGSLSTERRADEGRGHQLSCQFGFISRVKEGEEGEGADREKRGNGRKREFSELKGSY